MNNLSLATEQPELSKENQLLYHIESLIKKKHSLGREIIEIEKEIEEAKQELKRLYRDREHRKDHGKSTKREWSR